MRGMVHCFSLKSSRKFLGECKNDVPATMKKNTKPQLFQMKIPVVVEIRLSALSRARKQQVREAALLQLSRKTMFRAGFDWELQQQFSSSFGVEQVCVALPTTLQESEVAYFRSQVEVFVFRTHDTPPHEETSEHDDQTTTLFSHYLLPNREMEGIWENLVLQDGVKERLLNYSTTSLLFSQKQVDPNQVCCNRVFLFHGPPGSGKTSLCQALAQKLAIRNQQSYPKGFHLLKVNSNSLFSRFFSESGKLVGKLFELVRELASEKQALVILLIDEVESLTSSRSKVSAADPSDAVRVVNAMLTQIDRLRTYTNVMLFATSNITDQIDPAFMDRADVKMFLGHPDVSARFRMLQSCLEALERAGIVVDGGDADAEMSENLETACKIQDQQRLGDPSSNKLATANEWLWKAANASQDMSGRALRKMPFQAHAFFIPPGMQICTRVAMAQAFFNCIESNSEKV